jgi:hypothetical protein
MIGERHLSRDSRHHGQDHLNEYGHRGAAGRGGTGRGTSLAV